MTRHVFDDTTLECGDDFVLTTIVAQRAKKGDFAPNLVLTRGPLRDEETLETYVARQLVELAKSLKSFKLHGRTEVELAGRPARRIACGWQGTQGHVEQRMTMVAIDGRVLTFTVTVPKAKADELFPLFDGILATVAIGAIAG